MPNKTIYISKADEILFDEAKDIAGESLSTVIAKALREFVARYNAKQNNMKEIKIQVGPQNSQREQRFIGSEVGKWQGFSDDKEWYQEAKIYRTQKQNYAVHLHTVVKANLVNRPFTGWMNFQDSMAPQKSELFVGSSTEELKGKVPQELLENLASIMKREEQPVEFLDI